MDEDEEPGPDPSEAQAIDSFFSAIEDGDDGGVAAALRKVGKLSGFPLSYLAEILDPAAADSGPKRIVFAKPTKGRPPRKPNARLSPFLRFLSIGAAAKAAKALRSRKKLSGIELMLVADLFDKRVALPNGFSFRLQLAENRRGRPVNRWERSESDFHWRAIFRTARANIPKPIRSSIRATVREVIKILKAKSNNYFLRALQLKPLPSYSTIRNDLKRLGFLQTKKQK